MDLHSQACKLIYNINEYCKRETENKGPPIRFPVGQDQVAAACIIGKNIAMLSEKVNLPCVAKEQCSEALEN